MENGKKKKSIFFIIFPMAGNEKKSIYDFSDFFFLLLEIMKTKIFIMRNEKKNLCRKFGRATTQIVL